MSKKIFFSFFTCFVQVKSQAPYYCFQVDCFRLNPTNANDAILVWGDVSGCVNAINFSSATIALFERPAAPAGGKQGE